MGKNLPVSRHFFRGPKDGECHLCGRRSQNTDGSPTHREPEKKIGAEDPGFNQRDTAILGGDPSL